MTFPFGMAYFVRREHVSFRECIHTQVTTCTWKGWKGYKFVQPWDFLSFLPFFFEKMEKCQFFIKKSGNFCDPSLHAEMVLKHGHVDHVHSAFFEAGDGDGAQLTLGIFVVGDEIPPKSYRDYNI